MVTTYLKCFTSRQRYRTSHVVSPKNVVGLNWRNEKGGSSVVVDPRLHAIEDQVAAWTQRIVIQSNRPLEFGGTLYHVGDP